MVDPCLGERLLVERLRLDLTAEEFGALTGHTAKRVIAWEGAYGSFGKTTEAMLQGWERAGVDMLYIESGLPSHNQREIERELRLVFAEHRILSVLPVGKRDGVSPQDCVNLLHAIAARILRERKVAAV